MEDYRTLLGQGTGEYEEKHSRFIGLAQFADTEEKALAVLNSVRAGNRTARHNVYAYELREGNRTRYSEDGEPAKNAGLPCISVTWGFRDRAFLLKHGADTLIDSPEELVEFL